MKKKISVLQHVVDPLPIGVAPIPPDKSIETILIEDPGPVSVIRIIKPSISVQTENTFGGRVGFRLTGTSEDIKAAFDALREDTQIGCKTLLDSLKLVRTMMFAAKGNRVGR